jgi:DNA recombination protein RmuC
MLTFFNFLIIGLGFVIIYLLLKKEIEKIKEPEGQRFLDLQNKIIENFNLLKNEALNHLQTTLQKQEKIVESTAKIEESTRNIGISVQEMKNVREDIKEILVGPKSRGNLGEIMLEEILKNLPLSFYEKQYSIGLERVDYVLKLNDTLIPIDAKFPVQNFQKIFDIEEKNKQSLKKELIRNLKTKIDDISKKYILPSKGTIEFALMYLANEGIYYELLSDKDFVEVWDFAREKSVFITSPKTFELICSSLLLIIRRQELSQNIQQILINLHQLEKDLIELNNQFIKSYNQLKNSFNNLQEFEKILNRFIINYRSLIKAEQKLEEKIEEKSLI